MATIDNNVLIFTGRLQNRRGLSGNLEASDYIPAPGEILAAYDTGQLKVGDGGHSWKNLPTFNPTNILNSFDAESSGNALDALKGKELHNRLTALEGINGIDCGEIFAPVTDNDPDQSNG